MKNVYYYIIAAATLLSFPVCLAMTLLLPNILKDGVIGTWFNDFGFVFLAILWIGYDIAAVIICRRCLAVKTPQIIAIIGLALMVLLTAVLVFLLYHSS